MPPPTPQQWAPEEHKTHQQVLFLSAESQIEVRLQICFYNPSLNSHRYFCEESFLDSAYPAPVQSFHCLGSFAACMMPKRKHPTEIRRTNPTCFHCAPRGKSLWHATSPWTRNPCRLTQELELRHCSMSILKIDLEIQADSQRFSALGLNSKENTKEEMRIFYLWDSVCFRDYFLHILKMKHF